MVPTGGVCIPQGYYHFVRGVDVSSGGAVSAYVVSLINAGLSPAAWYSGGGYTLHSVEFRTYNALSKLDVVASVSLPGGLNAIAVDAAGVSHPMTDALWAETAISAAARAALSVGEAPLYPALRVFQPFPGSLAEEGALLAAAVATVRRWPNAGSARPGLAVGPVEGPDPAGPGSVLSTRVTPADSRIAAALSQHFEDFSRYDPAVAFFASDKYFPLRARRPAAESGKGEEGATPPSEQSGEQGGENGDTRTEVDADLAEMRLFAASAQLAKGDVSAARATLDTALEVVPSSSAAWALSSRVRLCAGDVAGAIRNGIAGANARPADALAWVTLADCLAIAGRHGDALRALNAAELPPPELDPFLRSLLPGRRRTTSATMGSAPSNPDLGSGDGSDGARIFATRLREEKNDRGSASGAAGVSGVDEMLAELPAKLMTDGERAVCAVLVRILDAIGWDSLLMVRSDCFVMEADTSRDAGPDIGEEGAVSLVVSATPEVAAALHDGEVAGNGAPPDSPDGVDGAAVASSSTKASDAPGNGGPDSGADGARSSGGSPSGDANAQPTPVAAVGIIQEDDGSGSPAGGPTPTPAAKAVCKTWLDYLVSSMYEDLRALAVWSAEEAAAARALAASANAAVANGAAAHSPSPAETSEDVDVEATGGSTTPTTSGADGGAGTMNAVRTAEDTAAATKRPAADWLRRAQLAARFSRAADAARAYEVVTILAANGEFPSLTAWCARMASAAEEGDAALTIAAAVAVTVTADGLRSAAVSSAAGGGAANTRGGGSGSGATTSDVPSGASGAAVPPIAVRRALYRLVSKIGLRRVREGVNKGAGTRVGPRLQSVLLDAVEWHVEGFDR